MNKKDRCSTDGWGKLFRTTSFHIEIQWITAGYHSIMFFRNMA